MEVDVEGAEGVAVKAAAPRLGARGLSMEAREGGLPAGIAAKVALVETEGVLSAVVAAKVAVVEEDEGGRTTGFVGSLEMPSILVALLEAGI